MHVPLLRQGLLEHGSFTVKQFVKSALVTLLITYSYTEVNTNIIELSFKSNKQIKPLFSTLETGVAVCIHLFSLLVCNKQIK